MNEEFADALPGRRHRHPDHRPDGTAGASLRGTRPTSSTRCWAATTTWSTWPATSAPTTPWRPTSTTTFDADDLGLGRRTPASSPNTLVLSAGCHSGYSIVDGAGVPAADRRHQHRRLDPADGPAEGVLIGGTGYQYGDTDFLEYSERLYLDIARRLHEDTGRSTAPIAVGKRPGAGQAGLPGRPQHAERHRPEGGAAGHALRPADDRASTPRAAARSPTRTSSVGTTTPVATGTAGADLGLATADLPVTTTTTPRTPRPSSGRQTSDLELAQRRRRRHHPAGRARAAQAGQGRHGRRQDPARRRASGAVTTPTPRRPAADRGPRDRGHRRRTARSSPTRSSRSGWPRPTTSAPSATAVGPPWSSTRRSTGRSATRTPQVPVNTVRNYSNLDMRLFYSPKTFNGRSASPTRARPLRRASARSRAPRPTGS